MNTKLKIALTLAAALGAAPARAALGGHEQQMQAQQQQMQQAKPIPVVRRETIKAASALEFKEVMKGVTKADLWGGPKALHAGITKFAAGTKFGLHSHSRVVTMVVISGTILHGDEAGNETKLTAGSYMSIPGGVKHTTACAAGSDCVFYEEVAGEFDMVMADAAKAP